VHLDPDRILPALHRPNPGAVAKDPLERPHVLRRDRLALQGVQPLEEVVLRGGDLG
jgi:hypothetical protein